MLDLRTIARMCGGEVVGTSALIPGPGHSARDRSLAVSLSHSSPHGFVTFSFSGDDFAACRDHVQARLGLPLGDFRRPAPAPAPKVSVKEEADQKQRIGWALDIWRASRSIKGTAADRYLTRRCGDISRFYDGRVLRFHPGLKFGESRVPTLVALFRDILTDEPKAIHRTFLDLDGAKLGRKALAPTGGCAVKLNDDAEIRLTGELLAAEGLESTLSGLALTGVTNGWMLSHAEGIASLPVIGPRDLHLTIFSDCDANGTGQAAATACATRWAKAGRRVTVHAPRVPGTDANDILANSGAAR